MISVSGHFVIAGRVGGAEHMFYNLLHGFCSNGLKFTLLCSNPKNFDPAFLQQLGEANIPIVANGSYHKRFIAEQMSVLSLGRRSAAVLFPNYFTPPFIPARQGRVVTLIHDFLSAEPWAMMSRARREWQRMSYRLTFARADRVVVPSEFVRDRAVELYGRRASGKTIVIPHPISWARFEQASARAPFDGRPYVLSVAAQYPHKNLHVLIQAFETLRRRFPDLLLVLVGQMPAALLGLNDRTDHINRFIFEHDLQSAVIATGYIDDLQLGTLYRHATIFAFPSLFEGFGMPPVEALGCGLPTLTTRKGSLPQVTMGAAFYLDNPTSVDEWSDKLTYLLQNASACRPKQSLVDNIRERYSLTRVAKLYERTLLS